MTTTSKTAIRPSFDPWEAYLDVEQYGDMQLTNVEFTTSMICNMRCGHCAVGYTLQAKEPDALPLDLLLKRLDEIPNLRTMSITGGEPMLSLQNVKNYVVPLLKYAHERGVYTQINSNLTLDLGRYEQIIPYVDVLHISHNWGTTDEFVNYGFAMMERKPTYAQREKLLQTMFDNAQALAKEGVFLAAETMLNKRTLPYLQEIHEQVVEMGCKRHEVHPMYPSDFASAMDVLSLDNIREAIRHLLDIRDENVWMLFGTLPFYHCVNNEEDKALLKRLAEAKNVTVRNDPDGRSRLNVSIFTGDIIITDFGDEEPAFGNIKTTSLVEAYETWRKSKLAKSLHCHCPHVKCLGPNLLVQRAYYPNWGM